MNVLSLFDGMSCGRVALERAGIEVENYYSSEVKETALKFANYNYPIDEKNRLGDITLLDESNLPKDIDLLIGGSPCFIKNTPIVTLDSIKSIEDIKVEDKVLTHTGQYKKVLKVGSQQSNIFRVVSQSGTGTFTTANHPYYVRERFREWDNEKRSHVYKFKSPKWVKVKNIKKGDYIGTPIIKEETNPLNLTEDECFLIGLYIGDGHTRKDYRKNEGRENHRYWQLILSIGTHETERLTKVLKIKHSITSHTKSVNRVSIFSKRLVMYVEENCGKSADTKYFSKAILNLPKKLLRKVIEGYLFSDGSVRNNVYRATTISKHLVETLTLAVAKVYRTTTSIEYTKRPEFTFIEGRKVKQRNTWTISFRKVHPKQSRAWVLDDIIWNPVKVVENMKYKDQVYNIEVEDDNSYIANNHIVHNCQGFSFSGKQLNFHDPRSKLFFEYVRILNIVKPKYFLLENVHMKKEYQETISNFLGVEPYLINSSNFSAQLRKRLYWTNIEPLPYCDEKIKFQDILETGFTNREKSRCILESESRPLVNKLKMFYRSSSVGFLNIVFRDEATYNKCVSHYEFNFKGLKAKEIDEKLVKEKIDLSVYEGIRVLSQIELERLQTLPEGYTCILDRNKASGLIGDGWTVDVISHILEGIKNG